MTCTTCKQDFCWICKKKFDKDKVGEHFTRFGCPRYPPSEGDVARDNWGPQEGAPIHLGRAVNGWDNWGPAVNGWDTGPRPMMGFEWGPD